MHRYIVGPPLGEGAFGQVNQATHKESGEKVAIKTLKKEKCKNFNAMMALPEIKALQKISHDNIVKCKELILDRKGVVHIVFELLPGGNLETLTRKRKEPLSEHQIRSVFYQLLLATSHMHSTHCMHRDIKPENVLVKSYSESGEVKIKLADLGLAKFCEPSNTRPQTTYVSTRWYRSPEILLRLSNYSYPSDLWAVGAVMAELVSLGEPLFPGDDEKDQLAKVVALRGHPAMVGWKKGENALKRRGVALPKVTPASLRTAIPRASLPVLQLISDLLELDPSRRPTAAAALQYPVFLSRHTDADIVLRTRKRQKLDSEGLDTGRTRDFPSSRWSYGTDVEEGEGELRNLQTHRFNLEDDEECGSGPGVISGGPAAPTQKMFHIPQFPEEEQVDASDCIVARRCPAGKFDMRI